MNFRFTRAICARLVAFALSVALAQPAAVAAGISSAGRPVTVIELFTSQGCSSCPAADALLHKYAEREGIIALSFHVDYWNNLGWKDIFSSADNTARQQHYAQARGDRGVYTPQAVINGRSHVVGSSAAGIDSAIRAADLEHTGPSVGIRAVVNETSLQVDVPTANASPATADILLAAVQPSGTVKIGRGENAGRTVTYRNVVRSLTKIGVWDGHSVSLSQSLPKAGVPEDAVYVVLLQQVDAGPILGATIATAATH